MRAKRVDHAFPVRARRSLEWRGWDPDRCTAAFSAPARHPQAIDQRYLVSWNNKQARGYRGTDENVFSSIYRSLLLEDRLKAKLRGGRKLTLPEVVDVMEVAGTADLRAHAVLPLGAAGDRAAAGPGAARRGRAAATAWRRAGGLRIDRDRDGTYEHADAIRIMDAWWPRWVRAQFQPVLGKAAIDVLLATTQIENPPNNHGDHLGSAYQGAWYGYARKDLRTVLGRKVQGPLHRASTAAAGKLRALPRRRCARRCARRSACPRASSTATTRCAPRPARPATRRATTRSRFRPVGGATQPLIPWINRPTYQQVNEIQARVPR